jgi:ferrous iron transport protein B
VLGLPLFLGLMYQVFHLTFPLGDPLMGWIEGFFGLLGEAVKGWWPEGSESLLLSLLADGIIGGVGGVPVFLLTILRGTILKGEAVPFVMELPPCRLPTLKGILIHMGERGWLYLRKAGTVILDISILLWAMSTFPGLPEGRAAALEKNRQEIRSQNLTAEEKAERLAALDHEAAEAGLRQSLAGRIGCALEPLLQPIGFDWPIGTALLGAFAAKKVFVAQLGIVYALGEADEESETLREKLKKNFTPLVGFCIMLFGLISAPCMATIAITRRESNPWRRADLPSWPTL